MGDNLAVTAEASSKQTKQNEKQVVVHKIDHHYIPVNPALWTFKIEICYNFTNVSYLVVGFLNRVITYGVFTAVPSHLFIIIKGFGVIWKC